MSREASGSTTEREDEFSQDEDQNQREDDSNNPPSGTEDRAGERGSQSPFTSGKFAGKTPAEVEEYLNLQEATVKAQGRALREMNERLNSAPAPEQRPNGNNSGTQSPVEDVPASEYFTNPMKYNRMAMKELLQEELSKSIEPFKQNLAQQARASAYDEVTKTYPKFPLYREIVDAILARAGNTNPSVADLEWTYITARGYAEEHGINVEGTSRNDAPAGDDPMNSNHRPAPPQHRPSSHPIRRPDLEAQSKKRRQLTEEEMAMARFQRMSYDEYLDYLELEDDAVTEYEPPTKK